MLTDLDLHPTDYADPVNAGYDTPLIIEPGEKLTYTCHHDNGVTRPVRMGCEETPGVAPGTSLSPARDCKENIDCAGFGTEQCVPANIVFGFTSNDEMCIMPGLYYQLESEQTGDTAAFAITQVTDTVDNPGSAFGDDNFSPSLSGDGTRVAYSSSTDPVGTNADGSFEIFSANVTTSPPPITQLTHNTDPSRGAGFAVLSDDGSSVVFTANADFVGTNADGNAEVFGVNADGTNLRQLTNTAAGTNGPFFTAAGLVNTLGLASSGDGSRVAIVSNAPLGDHAGGSQEVFVINADGTNLQQLTTGTGGDPNFAINGVSFNEDGTQLVFSSTANYTGGNPLLAPQIFMLGSDGSGLQQITDFTQTSCPESGGTVCIGSFITPTFSDDGSRISYLELLINIDNILDPQPLNTLPVVMHADGTGARQLFATTSLSVSCTPAALSQDGSRGAFSCTDGAVGEERLYVNNAAGDSLIEVAGPLSGTGSPPAIDDSGVTLAFSARGDPAKQAQVSLRKTSLEKANTDGNAEIFLAQLSASGVGAASLDNPQPGSTHAGIGVIGGWACDVGTVMIEIDGTLFQAAYGTSRGDTQAACGDTDNGFSLFINWNLLGNGEHTIRALADDVEFASTTFSVVTLGAEFLSGLSGEFTLTDFPEAGTNTLIRWEESAQNFVVVGTE